MARKRFYIVYPGNEQRGIPAGKLEVHPEDVDSGMISRLYTQRTPNGELERAPEAEARLGSDINTGRLWPIIEDIALGLYELASPEQPEAKALYDGLATIVGEELQTYSQQLAGGDIAGAKRTLEILGQKLTALASSTASRLHISTSEQETQNEAGAAHDKLFTETAQKLSVEIERGLGLYEKVKDIDSQLRELYKKVTRTADEWSLSDEDPTVQEHFAWLSGDEGFTAKVSRFISSPSTEQEAAMRELYNEAGQRLDALQTMIGRAETARARMQETALPVLNLPTDAARFLKQLQEVRKTIQTLPKDTVDEVVNSSELLTPEELDRWRLYETHPYFGIFDKVRQEFAQQAERIRRHINEAPSLSEEALAAITDAHRNVKRLQSRLGITAVPVVAATPKLPSARPSQRRTVQVPKSKPAKGSVSNDRLDEIYQLAIAVASYKYCSPRHLVGMTAASVLGILVVLGKVTEEEKDRYREALTERLRSRSITVTDNLQVRDLWEKTNPQEYDWIYFKPKDKGRWLWRLIKRAQAPGQHLAHQLGFTQEAVEKAFEDHKEGRLARYQQREEKK